MIWGNFFPILFGYFPQYLVLELRAQYTVVREAVELAEAASFLSSIWQDLSPWYSKSLSVFPPWLCQARIFCLVVNYLGWKTSLASKKHPALNAWERISKILWLTDTALLQTIKDHYNFHKTRNLSHTLWVFGECSLKLRDQPRVTLLEVEWKEASVHHYHSLVWDTGS